MGRLVVSIVLRALMRACMHACMIALVIAITTLGMASGADPTQSKCGGYVSCGPCVKAKGCGWCKTPISATNGTLSVVGCVEGSFSSGKGCSNTDYVAKQCGMANLYIILILVGLGILVLCCCYACVWWKCRKRSKRKNRKLLSDYDSWVDSIKSDGSTPKTSARRQEMRAKYGHLLDKGDDIHSL